MALGKHTLQVREGEETGLIHGWSLDNSAYLICARVVQDSLGRGLGIMGYPNGNPKFTNTYMAAALARVSAVKADVNGTPVPGHFSFSLYEQDQD